MQQTQEIAKPPVASRGGAPQQPPAEGANWLKAAKSRLKLELQGIAFAISHGASPQEYAHFLWARGAVAWMGTMSPSADSYLLKEMTAMATLFPWVRIEPGELTAERGVITMRDGCCGGYGNNRWRLARSLGLDKTQVCRYCGEAFKVWGSQLKLKVAPHPQRDESCKLRAARINSATLSQTKLFPPPGTQQTAPRG
ncbi:MAG: hypothetical protein HY687_06255 [Chloroflexi bacterium]|nr:hypothetical protein [Chloroflexota bacterium]